MEEKAYTVSEAVRLIGVESHVLRYWEEELKIPIRRTSQGHRIYSEADIHTFQSVKQWKEKGIQLKAIRLLLDAPEGAKEEAFDEQLRAIAYGAGIPEEGAEERHFSGKEEERSEEMEVSEFSEECGEWDEESGTDSESLCEIVPTGETQGNMEKAIQLLRQMMEEVVAQQNQKLEQQITGQIREEMELLYLQYFQAVQEAAAAREELQGEARSREMRDGIVRRILKRLFSEKR